MKILHIISTSKWTGPATYIVDIAEFLTSHNIDTLIAIRTKPSGNLKYILKEKNLKYTEEFKLYKKFNPFFFINDINTLNKIIKKFTPDIIHTHFSLENILTLFQKKSSFKLIRSIHNTKSSIKRPFSKFFLNKNDFIHTVCETYKKNLIEYNNVPEHKIKIIHGWVDTEKFNPKGEKYLKDKSIKIGMVARFQSHRGHEQLVKAFKNINIKKDVKLILTGRGEYKNTIEKLVKNFDLTDRVYFTGYLKEELPSLLRSLDIFVLLEEGSDGTCRAILEAMACGLPVISVKKGAIIDTVVDGENGFLISSKNNIEELTEKLKILINNENLRKTFSTKSREIIERKFSKKDKLNHFLEFYKEVLKEGRI